MANKQNVLARMELDKKNKIAAGLVSEKFPKVSGMVIHMIYYQRVSELVLMNRTINIFPNDYAYFNMDCMTKECLNGGFDLGPVIKQMVKDRKKTIKGKLVCNGENGTLSSGHSSVSYEINIKYH
ncbi:MAG: hypothetical protein LLF28_08585 [Nitrospiraceae bacterium]|nr:hypothetical protein [Nitrospiraceae bacterium]